MTSRLNRTERSRRWKTLRRRISDAANVAGTGVATAAGAVTRPFRSVDLDGDGVPDQPQAVTAVKGVGGAIAGAAGAVGGAAVSLFKTKKRGRHSAGAAQRRTEDTSAGVEEWTASVLRRPAFDDHSPCALMLMSGHSILRLRG